MSFHGTYGHLSSIDAAVATLQDIDQWISPKQRDGLAISSSVCDIEGYEESRLSRLIFGLQRTVILNNGILPYSGLPILYKK